MLPTRRKLLLLSSVMGGGTKYLLNDSFLDQSPLYYLGHKMRNAQGITARDGSPTAVTLEDVVGPYGDDVAAGFDGSTSFINVYSDSFRDAFDGLKGTIIIWGKVSGAGVWTDGNAGQLVFLQVDVNNRIKIEKSLANNRLDFTYRAGGTSSTIQKTGISETGFFVSAITWDDLEDEVKAYYNDSQEGSTQTGLGSWVGNLVDTLTNIGAQTTTPTNVFDGNLAHCAIFTEAKSEAFIASVYNAASFEAAAAIINGEADCIAYWPCNEREIDGTAARPGPGTRHFVDTGGTAYIKDGKLYFERAATNDAGIWWDETLARVAGRIFAHHRLGSLVNNKESFGFDDDQAGNPVAGIFWQNNNELNVFPGNVTVGAHTENNDMKGWTIQRTNGVYHFVYGGSEYPDVTLIWGEESDTTDPVYLYGPVVGNTWDSGFNHSKFNKVPDFEWLPKPEVYDTFLGTAMRNTYDFDGAATRIDCGSGGDLANLIGDGSEDKTFDFWLAYDDTIATESVFSTDNNIDEGIKCYMNSQNRANFRSLGADTDLMVDPVGLEVTGPGIFDHFTFVFDSSDNKMYAALNGNWASSYHSQVALVGSVGDDSSNEFRFGRISTIAAQFLDGRLGWARISSSKRFTPGENFDPPSRFTTPTQDDDTVEIWPIDEGSGLTAAAVVNGSNDGTITAGAGGWITNSLDQHEPDAAGPDGQVTLQQPGWDEISGEWLITSNKATNADFAVSTHEVAAAEFGVSDVFVDCDIGIPASNGAPSIALRVSDDDNYWTLTADVTTDELRLWENDGGVWNMRASASITINQSTTYSLRAIAYGQTIDGFLDLANKISYASAASNETETKHGFEAYGNLSDDTTWDNFTLFARDFGYGILQKFAR